MWTNRLNDCQIAGQPTHLIFAEMLDPTKLIGECTAQELALPSAHGYVPAQLIDASPGRFDAAQVLRDLETHRALWRSFLMGRPFLRGDRDGLPTCGLLPLRDLEQHWNLDTLYILAQSEVSVDPLLGMAEDWGCEVGHYTLAQAEHLMGTGRPAPIVWAWWD
ncbi:MAG: hypothetical protein J0L70_06295 [Leptolyngbya sp. UWPOB_LEPTO1]|uniref:hypothetical protein n=1 Tax=Leptolyngbya sp. UWPOB_LEPTO1 TaxID=2815653 RepID=UPI001AC86598|nr:hypothetical protein [Leptolyngbya sp. UWPOB_LEPTO1]MBN8560114.1 hypothetical protein [Leptolyngbya sp. UWPOB_LEPTO1]